MSQLKFSEAELYAEHDYVRLQECNGQRLHGGFDAADRYLPPRSRLRNVAIDAWTQSLIRRGGHLFDANASLLTGPRMPNVAQQCLLIREGLGQSFWNTLTITGKIEARGRVLAEMEFPELQEIIDEDISSMALGHLNRGMLSTHGLDEGGQPEKGIGGHDVMWFVARDLAFGAVDYPDVEPPENIARPEAGQRWMPDLPEAFEGMLSFLMNLLMIEFRAERGFADTQAVLRTPDLFPDRRPQAEEAADIVERIRTDEEIHVRSLRLYLGELSAVHLKTVDGGSRPGHEIIEPFWQGLVRWATEEQPVLAAQVQYPLLRERILKHPQGERILRTFNELSDPGTRQFLQGVD